MMFHSSCVCVCVCGVAEVCSVYYQLMGVASLTLSEKCTYVIWL